MSNRWNLKVISGPALGKKFSLESEVALLGRKKGDFVVAEDKEISSTHAELHVAPGGDGLVIVDLKSHNGTEVNGKRVDRAALKHGDRVRVGKTEFLIEDTKADTGSVSMVRSVKVKGESTKSVAASEISDNEAFDRFFFIAMKDVIERPRAFFESFSTDTNVARAVVFAIVSLLLSLVLRNFIAPIFGTPSLFDSLFNDWHPGLAFGLIFLIWAVALAVGTFLYHAIAVALGEKAPVRKAVQICCYATAGSLVTGLILLIPYLGTYLAIFGIGYTFYLLAIGASVAYKVEWKKAQIACGVAAFFIAVFHVTSYLHFKTQVEQRRVPAQQPPGSRR